METPGKRILKWREYLGKKPKEFEALTGIPYSTLKTLETDDKKGKPSYDVLAKLRKAFPQLNIDWLFDEGDAEPMLREGRALAPAKSTPAPTETPEAGPEPPRSGGAGLRIYRPTYEELAAENAGLHQRLGEKDAVIEDLRNDKGNLWKKLLAKTSASPEAADLRGNIDQIAHEIQAAQYVAPGFKQAVHRQLA